MLDSHPPFLRVIRDETNATDRQWLRMLDDAFKPASFDDLVRAGLDPMAVTDVLGVIALNRRINGDPSAQ